MMSRALPFMSWYASKKPVAARPRIWPPTATRAPSGGGWFSGSAKSAGNVARKGTSSVRMDAGWAGLRFFGNTCYQLSKALFWTGADLAVRRVSCNASMTNRSEEKTSQLPLLDFGMVDALAKVL